MTGYGLEGRGLIPDRSKGFLFSIESIPAVGSTEPHIQGAPLAVLPGVKWQGREADHLPPSSAEIKNGADILRYMSSCYSA
jgi:hypothetical protein